MFCKICLAFLFLAVLSQEGDFCAVATVSDRIALLVNMENVVTRVFNCPVFCKTMWNLTISQELIKTDPGIAKWIVGRGHYKSG